MLRFEELQMRLMDAAKNYLDVYEMSTLVEQYSLNKESRLSMTLPELKPPYPLSATITFSYDAEQTSFSLTFDDEEVDEEEDFTDIVEIDVTIHLPFLEGYNNVSDLFEEIVNDNPDLDPVLIKKEFFRKDMMNGEEYEIIYSYIIGGEELKDPEFYEELFFDLSNILRGIYEKTRFFIEMSWYREQEDDNF
ncbi:MAG: hypothetical protein QMD43_02305 [Thermodesulfovibrio sp.]|uniref:hypothetical protein n=1 Tax=unclassified Thermodesulfovibrio TaxID=2645936 RepID=UPI00083A77E3|nr:MULTISPECIES: hypothetical protein [unclassified Thermodesulfovibrio]MDI1470999.1 hypothetical protein [Thermodesulfovibrio sp. 1176]MDI6713849.1 hypothetical protein [Thermodesulfovibrio sp.]ODA43445.1 hypothetical protein THER_1829 [Thermodesulfovibrio sp. N1]